MPETIEVEARPLTKKTALEYLLTQGKPCTAKEVAIDLDSRTSTSSELLERCAKQGLVTRNEKLRPREYSLTADGRKLAESLRSNQRGSTSDTQRDPKTNPDSSDAKVSLDFQEMKATVRALTQAVFGRPSSRGEESPGVPSPAPQTASELSREEARRVEDEAIVTLYRARWELRSLERHWGLGKEKEALREKIAAFEGDMEKQTAEKIERLVLLEEEIYWCYGDGRHAESLSAVLELREALHIPANIFGPGPNDEGKAAEE
jgi:DNA-binding MarR family transcriptional regulator